MKHLHELEKEYILKNYQLFGPKAIAKELKRSEGTIVNFAKKNNLKVDFNNKMPSSEIPKFLVNLNFYNIFEEKIIPELSYFLGFFWADGTISRKSTLIIEILHEDGEIIKSTFNEIFPFSIRYRERNGRKPQMIFSVSDKKVGELLESLGKYPKSSENHRKIFNYINDDLMWIYFLRGLIDGDGNFYINEKEKYAQFTLASSFNQDWSFLLENLKNFNPNITQTSKDTGNSSVLRITGRENIINFIKYLRYDDITIGLLRKQEKALKIIKLYQDNPPKDWKKHVLQFDKNEKFIKEYNSAREASELTKIGISSIRNCLTHISKSAGGYVWIYKEEYKLNNSNHE